MPLPTSCGSGERFKLPMQLSLRLCRYSSTGFSASIPRMDSPDTIIFFVCLLR